VGSSSPVALETRLVCVCVRGIFGRKIRESEMLVATFLVGLHVFFDEDEVEDHFATSRTKAVESRLPLLGVNVTDKKVLAKGYQKRSDLISQLNELVYKNILDPRTENSIRARPKVEKSASKDERKKHKHDLEVWVAEYDHVPDLLVRVPLINHWGTLSLSVTADAFGLQLCRFSRATAF
jgi:hypothetical protein